MKKNYLGCMLATLALGFWMPYGYSQEIEIQNGAQFTVANSEYVESLLEVNEERTSFLVRAGAITDRLRVLNLDATLNEMSKYEIEIPEVDGKKVKYFW